MIKIYYEFSIKQINEILLINKQKAIKLQLSISDPIHAQAIENNEKAGLW